MVMGSVPALQAQGPDACAGDPETLSLLGPSREIRERGQLPSQDSRPCLFFYDGIGGHFIVLTSHEA